MAREKGSLREPTPLRTCSNSEHSLYRIAARKGGAGRTGPPSGTGPPTPATAGAKEQAQQNQTPAGARSDPKRGPQAARAPAGWSGAGEQAREGRPRAAPGAPRKGEHPGPQSGRTTGTGGAEEGDRTGSPTERRPARGASQRGGRAPPAERAGRAKPRAPARRAPRRAPRRGAGAQCAKSGGGPRHRRGSEGRAAPGAGPHTAEGAGTPAAHCGAGARAGRRRGPHARATSRGRGPPARRAPCAFRAHCRPRGPTTFSPKRMSEANSRRRYDALTGSLMAYERSEFVMTE